MPQISYPADLPITARREEIIAAIRQNQVVILAGETGSGKTTQLPKMCLEALQNDMRGQIGCTQPRRVAAMSVSKRVAEELNVPWGREVGCKMRFSDDTSRDTRIKFMTDGILLAEIQSDPMLRAYSVLILDEAHERSLNIDFLLGYLVGLLKKRPDLKLLVTSATIDTEAFSAAFGGAPIIEVSGRLYPVDIRYAPLEGGEDDYGFIDGAAAAVENALIETDDGDVLVFMPTERDIRDTRDLLDGRLGAGFEVLALFGRMASAEQQRIFQPGRKRRVVIATNVAETSITIPRIRYVVDTGLARISRYNPRTRTKRLPVEPVSQSSANQRAGRAGRVQDGICIRLYSQEDFEKRDRFTMPEIQRANLAEVILRMKAFKLGEIEDFPFINPPVSAAIRAGYDLLHELGSLSEVHELTPLGRELARLPLDPTLGRMLLQARTEKALPEMLIIAAGLSIPDPRERPEEKRELANAAHKAFAAPDSDFLTLLKIWNASPEPTGNSRNALRKFCKGNFLSFTRMQEWRDVWKQLCDSFSDDLKISPGPREPQRNQNQSASSSDDTSGLDQATQNAIHRSILAAQLGHIAMKEERNLYKAAGNRQVCVFPGSNLYERREKNGKGKPGQDKGRQPQWIVAGEIVQTSQLFARTLARIDPNWIAELGVHLCQFKYSEPHWNLKAGRVLVTQRVLIHGLEVRRQHIDFLKVDAVAATQMFIRAALVDSQEVPITQRFYTHNNKLRQKIETMLTRVRSNRVYAIEERLFRFYDERIKNVSSIHDLNRLVKEHIEEQPDFLCATEHDLTAGEEFEADLQMFPDQVALANTALPVTYNYQPGEETDGVTVRVPAQLAGHLTTGQIQWMVPGIREELANVMLRALPKVIRRQLMPIDPKAKEIAAAFDPGREDFHTALADFITRRYRIHVRAEDWPPQSLPAHLQPRVEVLDPKKNTVIAASRDLDTIRTTVQKQDARSDAWDKLLPRVERFALKTWSFGDLPETIVVEELNGTPILGYLGLVLREGEIDVRLFRTSAEAARGTPAAVRKLAENTLSKDLAWLPKELRSIGGTAPAKPQQPASFQAALSQLNAPVAAPVSKLAQQAHEHILAHMLRLQPTFPLTQERFFTLCETVRRELPAVTHRVKTLFTQLHDLRAKLLALPKRYPGLEQDIARLIPADLLATTPHEQLQHLPRYLKAIQIRNERCLANPAKDIEKYNFIADFDGWQSHVPKSQHETFRWMLEEYRVQIFAQELGTAQPVSAKRLEAMWV
ncbi:ATP-dependent RNA helicase HrpA [Prosthecobacter vanneervenii]|uniref:RNA helicase n=1 Tax=Prosthecobacter vanneervenii TaxID=48466 RepID=A0A7W8DLX3_9BACT|nr:ATP-dependent RNA helicase HrpA [Prosthecobacter vanneervenii]MBB5034819.1 ATP-dependent helicase HrpA [Prosthecobacter vanneervenii]